MPRRCLSLLGAALCASAAAAQELHLEGGVSFARGDYVYTERTNGVGAMAGFAWSHRRLTARATLPYFVRDTRILYVREGTAVPPPAEETDYEGSLADPLLQVSYTVFQTERSALGLAASVKVPVVETGAFGTGRWDLGGSASLSRFVGSATLVGLDVGYWRLGDMRDLPLQDTVTGTFTLARSLGRDWVVSASLSGSRSAVAGYADPWWGGVLLSRSFAGGSVGLMSSVGLSDGAPDFALGLLWRARIDSPGARGAARPRSPRLFVGQRPDR